MRNILIRVGYDGSGFHGWQLQAKDRTVQAEVERALSFVCREEIRVHGASRTDRGVHAYGLAASFKGNFAIPTDRIPIAANGLLSDARIMSAEEMPEDFHARYDAVGKTYRYVISMDEHRDIFKRNYRYELNETLNQSKMEEAAAHLVGTHDFKAFRSSGSGDENDTVRTIFGVRISDPPEARFSKELHIEVTGDGFLYNMVRIIAGTLIEVGLGRTQPEEVKAILQSKDRSRAGYTAPAAGLYLLRVYYDPKNMEQAANGERYQSGVDIWRE
jgi:tRNA pseudouridine38-40 synthase